MAQQQQRMQCEYGAAGSAEVDTLIPPSVITTSGTENCRRSKRSVLDDIESLFSSVRSLTTSDLVADLNDSDLYFRENALARAFPERFIALTITLILEVPVLFMISGGSDRLCSVLGRTKYQLLIAFLPLASAISGNCGLQCSTLTTRAISHSHVTSKTIMKWLSIELRSSLYLGGAMGIIIGIMAYMASNRDIIFGLTIGTAQVLSIMTAGLTGTLAPLLFTFVFHRDAGKWGGPLETAIQDIVGSFAMVVLSHKLLIFLVQESTFNAAPIRNIAALGWQLAPLLFSLVFHRDLGKWGGPLETAIHDIVGSFAMVVLSNSFLIYLGPVEVSPADMCGGAYFT